MSSEVVLPDFDSTKQFNFYCNIVILLVGFVSILFIMRKNGRNVRDVESYDWSKFTVSSDNKANYKKNDKRDKLKQRVKEVPKTIGFIKEENKFQPNLVPQNQPNFQKKDEDYLNLEEVTNLQDLINFTASKMVNESNEKSVEDLYKQYKKESENGSNYLHNENLDISINEILTSTISDIEKINRVLEKGNILKRKTSKLAESTYFELVQLFIRNGYLNHASFFLCQMDRLKIKIPRRILDLFLESNLTAKAFEKNNSAKENNKKYANKFDEQENENQDFAYYNTSRMNFEKRNDLEGVYSELKLDAKPFIPKAKSGNNAPPNDEDDKLNYLEKKFSGIDPSQVKEFIPKHLRNKKE